jgi:hypothetical protein
VALSASQGYQILNRLAAETPQVVQETASKLVEAGSMVEAPRLDDVLRDYVGSYWYALSRMKESRADDQRILPSSAQISRYPYKVPGASCESWKP